MARARNQGSKWIRRSTRLAIYSRDGFCCAYCGATAETGAALTLDHVQACELGGSNEPTNLVAAPDHARVVRGAPGPRRRQTARKIDRAEGRRLAALRSETE